MTTAKTYSIEASNLPFFKKLFANAVKKAEKLGVPAMTCTIGEVTPTQVVVRGHRCLVNNVSISISGMAPKLNGWSLVGVVSPLKTDSGEVISIITTVPGETVKGSFKGLFQDPLWCDHCKTRRDRIESFIVCHEDGTEKQVGRQCLADFLGDVRMSPGGLASLMNTIASIENSVSEWSRAPRQFAAESFNLVLAATLSVVRVHGYVSTSVAYDTGKVSTKANVSLAVNAFLSRPENMDNTVLVVGWEYDNRFLGRLQECMPTNEDFVSAAKYREELNVLLDSKEEKGLMNDYLNAIRILNFAGTVNKKAMGIAVSAIAFVDREINKTTDPIAKILVDANKTSQFIGTPKKREVFQGAVFIENFQTSQGFSIATFVHNGNVLKTFSRQDLERGTKVNLKATTVRHDTYNGINQTIVNRPVVVK